MPTTPPAAGGRPPVQLPSTSAPSSRRAPASPTTPPAASPPSSKDTFEAGPANPKTSSARASARAGVVDTDGPGSSHASKFDVKASAKGLDINGSLTLDAHLLNATGKVEKQVEFDYRGEKFRATISLNGNLKIGADASLDLNFHIGTDGKLNLDLSAEGFAGAKGELKGAVTLDSKRATDPDGAYAPLMEGTASVTAYAGAAVSASFKVSGDAKTGTLDFEAKAAASAGVGAGFGMEGTLDLWNIAGMAKRVGTKIVSGDKALSPEA